MNQDGTWEVVASPSERWYLALFLMRNDLKFKGDKATKLWRFRCTFGLVEPSESFLRIHGVGTCALAEDRKTKNIFRATQERADFIADCIGQVEGNGAELMMFQRILAQLEDKAPSADIDQATPFDAKAEDWTPTLAPTIHQPGKLIEVLVEALNDSADFGTWKARMLDEATPKRADAPARLSETAQA